MDIPNIKECWNCQFCREFYNTAIAETREDLEFFEYYCIKHSHVVEASESCDEFK